MAPEREAAMPFKPSKRTRTERISTEELGPSRADDKARAGSIEQQLDMCESGPLRGDDILHNHGVRERTNPHPTLNDEQLEKNYRIDMSEEDREGMEESGDEHSAGLQGDEMQELQYDDHFGDSDAGIPGEMTEKLAKSDPTRRGYRRRAA
jgi:hypothetical protein